MSFSVEKGEYVAIMGESGSGKTTLLNILASLDKPTSGEILLNGKNIVAIKDSELRRIRREHLGFVFQDFNLLDTFPCRTIFFYPWCYPAETTRYEPTIDTHRQKLEITDSLLEKYPYEVSGGQKQRAAVARALITHPR